MPEPLSDLQSYYAARAQEYDRIYAKPERQADLRAIEAWLPPLFRGARVLEVACGTGYWTQFIAPAASHVTAIDSAPETLQIARARPGCAGVDFHIGDAYALPESPDRFDAAFAGFWYSHVPLARVRAFLQGLQARLQPGSRVVLLDNRYVAGSSTAISETDADGNTYQARPLADGSSHRVLKNFPMEAQLQAAIEGLGRGGQWRQWPHYWAFEYATNL
jgi:demethylmenaquinone methyltransferase/2-methoxy-6-polyprenyl-1,4-benzoquinol methylase